MGTIILAILFSGLVAGTVQQQLAIAFNAHEEFIAAVMLLVLFVLISGAAFLVALFAARKVTGVNLTAIGLAAALVLALMLLEALCLASSGGNQGFRADAEIQAELFFPGIVVILIQWWLVRRRWLKNATR